MGRLKLSVHAEDDGGGGVAGGGVAGGGVAGGGVAGGGVAGGGGKSGGTAGGSGEQLATRLDEPPKSMLVSHSGSGVRALPHVIVKLDVMWKAEKKRRLQERIEEKRKETDQEKPRTSSR